MKEAELKKFLEKVASKEISQEEAFSVLKDLPFKDIGFAKLDMHRSLRNGTSEIIFGRSKTCQQLSLIMDTMIEQKHDILVTHIDEEKAKYLCDKYSEAVYNEQAKTLVYLCKKVELEGLVAIVTAGTSDLEVAFEAEETLNFLGVKTEVFSDVGVAGLHRLLAVIDDINKANVVIVVAGMDGALPSVVGGLINKPIIAVPTSCGYGTAFGGVSALLTMLNSCAAGVTVVNIDNGFGAGFSAARITKGCLK